MIIIMSMKMMTKYSSVLIVCPAKASERPSAPWWWEGRPIIITIIILIIVIIFPIVIVIIVIIFTTVIVIIFIIVIIKISEEMIWKARRLRKALGGGMRQTGEKSTCTRLVSNVSNYCWKGQISTSWLLVPIFRPFDQLGFVFCFLWALRPCDLLP